MINLPLVSDLYRQHSIVKTTFRFDLKRKKINQIKHTILNIIYCPSCKTMYMDEKGKRDIANQSKLFE